MPYVTYDMNTYSYIIIPKYNLYNNRFLWSKETPKKLQINKKKKSIIKIKLWFFKGILRNFARQVNTSLFDSSRCKEHYNILF